MPELTAITMNSYLLKLAHRGRQVVVVSRDHHYEALPYFGFHSVCLEPGGALPPFTNLHAVCLCQFPIGPRQAGAVLAAVAGAVTSAKRPVVLVDEAWRGVSSAVLLSLHRSAELVLATRSYAAVPAGATTRLITELDVIKYVPSGRAPIFLLRPDQPRPNPTQGAHS